MSTLRISFFGPMHLEHNEGLTEIKPPRIVQTLLAYLLLTPHRYHSREILMAHFWADSPPSKLVVV
jgi:DNA-binding SARP family transcriptional activator